MNMAKGFFRMQPKGLRIKAGDCKRLQTFKAVNIEVLSEDNKRVIKRFRFTPPTDTATGKKRRFLESGIEQVLENFIASFERDNPNHRYRLVQCNGKFRLVWIPETDWCNAVPEEELAGAPA